MFLVGIKKRRREEKNERTRAQTKYKKSKGEKKKNIKNARFEIVRFSHLGFID